MMTHRHYGTIAGLFATTLGAAQAAPLHALYSFKGGTDGAEPVSRLIQQNGVFYGTTMGDNRSSGTVFKFDPKTHLEAVLHDFSGGADGGVPMAGLCWVNGLLYGTTLYGGAYGMGTVFVVDPATGIETVLHSFGGADGSYPQSGVIELDGVLYGTAGQGGASNDGVLYSIDLAGGASKVLYTFEGGADGYGPLGSLTAHGGLLYGTTYYGGSTGWGTVFAFDPQAGTKRILHSFNGTTEGSMPSATLIYRNGMLYGATQYTVLSEGGAVFAIDAASGAAKVLHSFTAGNDGAVPRGEMIDDNGVLYGTTAYGGAFDDGTVFSIDLTSQAETILHVFTGGVDGARPFAGVTRYAGGLYGTTQLAGAMFTGTIYRQSLR